MSSTTASADDVLPIAILGAGISGLATYLQLTKHLGPISPPIKIFEAHAASQQTARSEDGVPSVGAAYGLAANGMASLRRLDPGIHAAVQGNSFPTPRFTMRSRRGATLGAIPSVIGDEACCMVTREVVLGALEARVPAGVVERGRRVVGVVDGKEVVVVRFEDGQEVRCGVVVGADGIWSFARKAIHGGEEVAGPEYRGLATLGGFIETKHLLPAPSEGALPYPQSQTIMTFGHNGFLGYTPCTTAKGSKLTADHIRGKLAVPRGEMAFWWARSAQADSKMEPDLDKAKQNLAQRMASWRDPNIPRILEHSLKTAVMPTYVLPKQRTWVGRRVVLVGDAAHALPTSSGQGVSQALEDAEALAMLLAHQLPSGPEDADPASTVSALQKTFQQYEKVRKAHVERILDAGNRGGDASRDLNVVAEYALYAFFWVMLKFFGRFVTKEIEDYDVVKEVDQVLR